MNAIMKHVNIMKNQKYKIIHLDTLIRSFAVGLLVLAFGSSLVTSQLAGANSSDEIQKLQEQIEKIESVNHEHNEEKGILSVEASSLSDAINKLQAQIDASQARIAKLEGEISGLEKQIEETQKELEKQKELLGQSIRAMYVSGDITTVEMLATSDDLSEFFDAQQYQDSVRQKIKNTLDTITQLKLELNTKRDLVKANLTEQQGIKEQIQSQQAEKARILSLNQAEQDELEQKIQENNGRLAELKQKQAEAEAALARALSSGSYKVASIGPVAAGTIIGSIGNTGLSSGPHLHLEVRTSSGIVDPTPYIKSSPVNIPPAWVSQGYGVPNSLYISGYHRGIDYASGSGSPIFAIASGQLYRGCSNLMLGTSGNDYGYVAIIEHSDGSKSVYAHMSGGPADCDYNTYY